ncbi:tail fiber domain-containing protein [Flavobacterium sp.]|uniref:tail fiber domain-containing protein n=1 Tax=Flavobacterium sp. TaxID=239 RepID=UPI00391D9D3F
MIKKLLLLLLIVLAFESKAQVGVNTTDPKAQLDIRSTNQVTPSNTDGLLIPKINAFPVTSPTVDQQGMLVYLTTTVGANTPGFYYWNNPTTAWLPVKGTDGGTLDQAYDFGGAGNGRTITADTGAVTIDGTDGLVVSGTSGSGALVPSGAGTRMVWNPRKAAFRVGTVSGTLWDDASIGNGSVAFGNSIASGGNAFAGAGGNAGGSFSFAFGSGAIASGQSSFAFGAGAIANIADAISIGFLSTASGPRAVALGTGVTASGQSSTALGAGNTANGFASTAFGNTNVASGSSSTAFGNNNTAFSFGETVLGIGATTYTPSSNGATQFRNFNATDRLFVIGNAIDDNNNSTVDDTERSDAMVVLKSGRTGFGTSSPLADIEIAGNNVNTTSSTYGNLHIRTVDNYAADVGGSISIGGAFGAGVAPLIFYRNFASIEARKTNNDLFDQNAYLIFKTLGTGGFLERMRITANGDVGIGTSTPGSKLHVVGNLRMVDGNQASGRVLTSDVNGTATWQNASANAWGLTGNTGTNSATNFIGTTDNTDLVFRRFNAPSGRISTTNTFFGLSSGSVSTAQNNTYFGALAGRDNVTGQENVFIGRGAGALGTTGSGNVLIGNGAGILNEANQNAFVGAFAGNSNSTGGNNSFFGHFSGVSTSTGLRNTFLGAFTGSVNTIGTDNTLIGSSANVSTNSLTNASAIGASAEVAASNSLVLGSIIGVNSATATVNVGIGTTTPLERLHVAGRAFLTDGFSADNAALIYRNNTDYMFLGPQSGSSANGGAMALFGSTNASGGNAGGVDFNVPNGQVRMSHNNGSYIFRANSTSGYAATFELNDIGLQIGHNSASRAIVFNTDSAERMRLTAAGRLGLGTNNPGGQLELSLNEGRKPATSTWTITSDARLKDVNGIYQKGLTEILQLKPIRYHYKNTDKKSFEPVVLEKEAYGFLAQEVQQIFPEAVGIDADGYLNFDLHPILVAYTNAFKELDLKNQAAENKNRELELKLKSQEQIISNLIERLEKLEAKN